MAGTLCRSRLEGEGVCIVDLMVESGLWTSRAEAKREIQMGGANLNDTRVLDLAQKVTPKDVILDGFVFVRKGKWKQFMFKVV